MVLFSSQPPEGVEESEEYLEYIRIITIQGHPEFHHSLMSKLIDHRVQSGALDPEIAKNAKFWNSREAEGEWKNDGVVVGKVIWGMLGIREV